MIESRRRAHRVLVGGLGPIALASLGVALAARESPPTLAELPGFASSASARVAEGQDVASPRWTREDLFGAWPARVTLRVDGTVELKPLRPIGLPDVLVYWVAPREDAGGEGLPADAHLLGRIGGTVARSFRLPAHAETPSSEGSMGRLVLYSLGHQEVFASASLPAGDFERPPAAGGAP